MVFGESGGVELAAFFVRFGEENHVAGEGDFVLREEHDGLGEDGESAFEVDGATADDVTVFNDAGKGIDGPLFPLDSDDIGMGREQDRLPAAIAFQAGDEVRFVGIGGGDDIDLKAEGFEFGLEERRHLGFVAWGITRVDADELGEQFRGVIDLRERGDAGKAEE